MSPTEAGSRFRAAVVSSLDTIRSRVAELRGTSDSDRLATACSHDVSRLVLAPRYDALGDRLRLRIAARRETIFREAVRPG